MCTQFDRLITWGARPPRVLYVSSEQFSKYWQKYQLDSYRGIPLVPVGQGDRRGVAS